MYLVCVESKSRCIPQCDAFTVIKETKYATDNVPENISLYCTSKYSNNGILILHYTKKYIYVKNNILITKTMFHLTVAKVQ